MSLRWRLNLSVLALIAVFLAAAALTVQAVRQNAEQTRNYLKAREASQFVADLRTHLYQQLARQSAASGPAGGAEELWASALDDIDIQIRQSSDGRDPDPRERELWQNVRARLERLSLSSRRNSEDMADGVRLAERDLGELRHFYDLTEYQSAVTTANGSYLAQAAIGLACGLTVLLFLIYLLIVRRWLVRPIQVLKDAAETIGRGRLDHRVPLVGSDELSQLARGIDAMADGLARYQADLVRSRELSALGELCANVAHGLRNPLAAIRSTAQLAERRADSNEQKQIFQDVSAQALRMDDRISSLFQFSRPIDLQSRPTAFGEVVASAQAQARPLLESRGIHVEIDDASGNTLFELDSEQVAQALAELLTNAAHHSPAGSSVKVRGESRNDNGHTGLVLTVTDEGAGMSPATAHKAFDLFFTSRPEGTGIGLTLVRRIVERHGGEIAIESQPGHGTTVCMRIASLSSGNGHTQAHS